MLLSPLVIGEDVDDPEFMDNCWSRLVSRFEEVGFDGLTESERVYFLVQLADAEVNNGGFHAVCYNPTGEYGTRFVDAFRAIGATGKASLFDNLNSVFGADGLPEDFRVREAAHSALSKSESANIDELDTKYFDSDEQIDDLLRKWVESEEICL